MPKRVSLEARIALLDRGLADLERRVHAIEAGRAGAKAEATTSVAPAPAVLGSSSEPVAATSNVALAGRTLLVLSGAYLFRALTDSGLLPPTGGVAAGLVYALLWLAGCDRTAARGSRRSAAFHGIAAAVIAYPLIWETTARFGVLDAGIAAALLWTFSVSGLAVARRHGLAGIAWLNMLLSVASGLSLLVVTRQLLPFLLGLLALAVLNNGLRLADLPAELAGILTGVLLIAAIGANRLFAERSRA